MDLTPKNGVTLDQYLEVFVRARLDLGPDLGTEIAVGLGIEETRWRAAAPLWKALVAKHIARPEIVDRYNAMVEKVDGAVPTLSMLEYADICVRLQRGEALEEVTKEHGLDTVSFSRVSFAMVEKLTDARVNAVYTAAHRKASAYEGRALLVNRRLPSREGKRSHSKEGVAPPERLRGRRCPSCGAFKLTPHRHVYIYCDFCGALFDYDVTLRNKKEADLAADASMDLLTVIEFEALPSDPGEAKAHQRAARSWMQHNLVELFPNDHPPRVRELAYRTAYVEGWLVPTQLAWSSDPVTVKSADMLSRRQQLSLGKEPSFASLAPLYKAMADHLAKQAVIAEREGFFQAHPDAIDTERFLRFSRSAFVASLIGTLSADDAEALIDLAELRCEMIEPPSMTLTHAGCAGCGAELTLADGATRAVCVDCGLVVQADDRRACRACGAVLVGSGGHFRTCGYCHVAWESV